MDRSEQLFLNVFSCGLNGEKPEITEIPTQEIWHQVVRLAVTHSVLPMVIQSVWYHNELKSLSLPFMPRVNKLIISQAHRTAEFQLLYEYLIKQGLCPVVIKGIILRDLYPHPEHRSSVDEDLLILREEFPRYHQALCDYGLQTVSEINNLSNIYEISYEDKGRGLYIELHMSLFPEDSTAYGNLNSLFDGVWDCCTKHMIYSQAYSTLSTSDHILYLICHIFKHFLHSGIGIRQIADIALFSNAYYDSIDWDHVYSSCRSVHIEVFTAALFEIAHQYLTLHKVPEPFAGIAGDIEPLLEDILASGVHGASSLTRLHSSNMTLNAVANQKKQQDIKKGTLRHILFPSAKRLAGRYPYLKKVPILLPLAWVQRAGHYLTENRKNRAVSDAAESLRLGEARIQLLKQYGIIQDKDKKRLD